MKYLKNPKIILISIILLGAFLRFYKLDWGEGYFFNPDENDVGISVNQLSFPDQMHPHMFKYGTLNIYLIYFTKIILGNFNFNSNPLIIGRFYSALFSTITILIVFLIAKKILTINFALTSAFLVAITPGLIQQAHFATPETNQIFFLFLSLLFLLHYTQHTKLSNLFIVSSTFGLTLAVKVSSIAFLPSILLAPFFIYRFGVSKIILSIFTIIITAASVFLIISPYVLIDYTSFQRSILFEKQVATGEISVFYTRQFINTTPFIFQMKNIFPYALGPILQISGILGLLICLLAMFRRPDKILILIIISFLFMFLTNAVLFVKWTRYMSTILPYFAIFAAYFLYILSQKLTKLSFFLGTILILSTLFWSISFFTIYTKHDIRIASSNWVYKNIPSNTSILVESANVIDVPTKGWNNRHSLDFYNLDTNSEQSSDILTKLEQSDFFLVQSRRVFFNHQRLPNLYPKTANFYNKLFNDQLGFEEIQEFHSFPKLEIGNWKLEIPDDEAEETWSVFDHPVVRIYQKSVRLSKEDYENILKN